MNLNLVIVEIMHIGRNCKGYKLISQSCNPEINDLTGIIKAMIMGLRMHMTINLCAFKNLSLCMKSVCTYVRVMCTVNMVYSRVLQSCISSDHITNVIFYFTTHSL